MTEKLTKAALAVVSKPFRVLIADVELGGGVCWCCTEGKPFGQRGPGGKDAYIHDAHCERVRALHVAANPFAGLLLTKKGK